MSNKPIGILDSGVGGLSIWKELVLQLPSEQTIYIADSRNCPYGTKTRNEIYRLTSRLVKFLIKNKVKLVVLACNTITVSCLDRLREDFPDLPIVGTVPVVKTAAEKTRNKKIGIFSTNVTAKSNYQKKLIKKFASDCQVLNIGTNELVPLIEAGEIEGPRLQAILKKALKPFIKKRIDALAIGCSHFPFLQESIQEVLGKDVFILDSGGAIARQVRRILINNNKLALIKKPSYIFYTTGDAGKFTSLAKKLIGAKLTEKIKKVKNVSLD